MNALVHQLFARLEHAGLSVALVLPNGQCLEQRVDLTSHAPQPGSVHVQFADWRSMARMAAGQVGAVAQDYVEGRVQLQGSMREIAHVAAALLQSNPAHVAAALLQSNPAQSDVGHVWWSHIWRRTVALAAHTKGRDAKQIQFHYDVSDEFYALWLDAQRVYSCAYFEKPEMSLAQAQQAKLDHICRKLMLQPGERLLDIGAGWGALLLWQPNITVCRPRALRFLKTSTHM
jgi:cyclopropane-fatty-acyl-phospholipid synthase